MCREGGAQEGGGGGMGTGNVIRIPGWNCGKYNLYFDLIDGLG